MKAMLKHLRPILVVMIFTLLFAGCNKKDEKAGGDAKADHPTSEQPKGEEGKADHPTSEHPKSEEGKADHPTSEHPKGEEGK